MGGRRINIKQLFLTWRWYTLGKQRYTQSMDRIFFSNLDSLCTQNALAAILVCCFFFFPVFFDRDYKIALVYLAVAALMAVLSALSALLGKKHKNGKNVDKVDVFSIIVISYTIIVFFGIFLSVIINPLRPASVYLPIIVAALFFVTASPPFKLILTLIGWAAFLAVSFMIKSPEVMAYEVTNSAVAIALSLIVSWHGSMLRITSADKTIALENERDIYHDQSMVDELTTLKNRRDFMQRLERYFNRPRYADDVCCLAIADVDYFKNYNDYYGHQKGDECLRAIGKTLGAYERGKNIYAARVGGEEFALLWFVGESVNIEDELQQILESVKKLNIPHEQSDVAPYVTLSMGAYVQRCGFQCGLNIVYENADKALYRAKSEGRNRLVVHDAR